MLRDEKMTDDAIIGGCLCGSAVWNENSGWPDKVFLAAGGLDNPEKFRPQVVVYASRSPSWAKTNESLPTFPEMPPSTES